MISKELLDILCCPNCHADLTYDEGKQTLTCVSCGHIFEIKDGIPVMLMNENPDGNS